MNRRKGSFSAILIAVVVLALLGATAYLGTSAIAERKIAQGEKLLRNKEYAAALDIFKDAEKYNRYVMRKNSRVIEGLAESSYGLKDYGAALNYYTQLTENEPDNAKTRYRLGLLCVRAKEYGKAREQIKKLEEMRTDEAQNYADELSSMMREGVVKGIFKDIYDNLAPNISKIPNLADIFEVKPRPDSDGEKQRPATPDARGDFKDNDTNRQKSSI